MDSNIGRESEVALSIAGKILEAFGATREQRDRFRRHFAKPEEQPLEI